MSVASEAETVQADPYKAELMEYGIYKKVCVPGH